MGGRASAGLPAHGSKLKSGTFPKFPSVVITAKLAVYGCGHSHGFGKNSRISRTVFPVVTLPMATYRHGDIGITA